jgi:hypothetical protein
LWTRHHPCIVPKNIQLRFLGKKFFCGFLDGGEIVEVEVEVDEGTGGGGREGLDGGDCGGGFLFVAGGDVDFGVVRVEDLGEFFAYAAGGAGDDEDLDG